MTPEATYEIILHWITTSINEDQLEICHDVAKDHFNIRTQDPERLAALKGAIDLKMKTLPK